MIKRTAYMDPDPFDGLQIGQKVRYHPVVGRPETDGKIYIVREFGLMAGNEMPVAWLIGKAVCVRIDALEKVKE